MTTGKTDLNKPARSFARRLIEYVVAAPILGAPCMCIVPYVAEIHILLGIFAVVLPYIGFAALQLLEEIPETELRNNKSHVGFVLFCLIGGVSTLGYFVHAYNFPVSSTGEWPSDATVRGTLLILTSWALGFSIGLTVIVMGYWKPMRDFINRRKH